MEPVEDKRYNAFVNAVNSLNVRFKVAEIVRRTGAKKGNVSAYIKGTKPVSDNFLNTFYEKFKDDLVAGKEASIGELTNPQNELSIEVALKRERESADRERKALENDKAFLQEIIRSNLTLVLASLKTISIRQEAAGEVVLGSLARLEERPEDELIEVADTRRAQIEKEWQTHGSTAAANK